ncbi:universal stress protein [Mycobacterium sp. SMC-18]|uniref:universal stress protein n=1 Tax=Mycobacterium sp. SMC-18 TaxID=3381629 RepID=UPI0038768103
MSNPRIAVAYLATPGGDDAVAVGEQIARTLGAEIDLCMVLPRERSALATTPGGILQREAESWLAAAAAGVPSDLKVTTHLSFDESSTAGLIAAAEAAGAEALVVGGAGGGIAGSLSLGSVVNDLVHASPIPVVIAPRGARLKHNDRIREVTCAVGTRPGAKALLDSALRLCRDTGTPLRLVSLVAVDDADDLELAQQHAQNALDQAKAFLPADIPVTSRVATGTGVEDAVNKLGWHDGDVIMVGSSRLAQPRRLFLGSTAAKMLRVLQVPMIVVPKDEGADND